MAKVTILPRYPYEGDIAGLPGGAQNAFRAHGRQLHDLNQAIVALKSQQTDTASAVSTAQGIAESAQVTASGALTVVTQETLISTIGGVNNQSGTTYTTQGSDYGGIVTFNSTSAVAVTLNSTVPTGWFATLMNLGSGTVTITPQSGTINAKATLTLTQGVGAVVFYDGSNWWAFVGGGGSALTNPMTTEGDIIYGTGSGTPTRLGIGASGTVLTSNGTDPVWQASATAIRFQYAATATVGQTAFTLPHTPTAATEDVFINGVIQRTGTDYTISGANVTMTYALESGDSFYATGFY